MRIRVPFWLALASSVFAQNVGIGTSTPSARLHVWQPVGNGIAPLILADGGANAPKLHLRIQSDGTHNAVPAYLTVAGSGGSAFWRHYITNWGAGYYWSIGSAAGEKVVARIAPGGSANAGGTQAGLLSLFTATDAEIAGTGPNPTLGTEQVRLAASGNSWLNGGNVGIGTTTPALRLDVAGQARVQTSLVITAASASEGGQLVLGGIGDYTLTTENCNSWSLDVVNYPVADRFRIFRGSSSCSNNAEIFNLTSSGMIGLLQVDPRARLHIGDRWTFHDGGWKVISYNGYWDAPANTWRYLANDFYSAINFTNGGAILFRTAPAGTANAAFVPADRMVITNVGNVGIDVNPPLVRLDVRKTVGHGPGNGTNNDAPTTAIITGGATARQNDWPNGWGGGLSTWDIACSGIRYSTLDQRSDRRYKHSIAPLKAEDLLSGFMRLRPVSYYYDPKTLPVDEPERLRFGFIANEVETLFPNLVTNAGLPDHIARGLEYDGLIPVLVSVVQAQQREIQQLRQQVSTLEQRLAAIEAQLSTK